MRRGGSGMSKQPRQKKAEIQRLSSISNLRTKQLAGSVLSKNTYGQQEAERIEHFDIELRPTKLNELKMGDVVAGSESMVAGFLDAISKVRKLSFNDDDDIYDRLSRRYTVVMLTLFAVVISTKQYVGDPIACWTPAQFTGAHVEYTNYICWISNKYYVDFRRRLPGHEEPREHKIAYYQWVPFILLTMMLFFYVPNTLWKFLTVQNGFDIAGLVKLLNNMDALHPVARQRTIRHTANLVQRSLHTSFITSSFIARSIKNKLSKLREHASLDVRQRQEYIVDLNDNQQTMTAIPVQRSAGSSTGPFWTQHNNLKIHEQRQQRYEESDEYSEEELRFTKRKKRMFVKNGLEREYSVRSGCFVRLRVDFGFVDRKGEVGICWLKDGNLLDDNYLNQHKNVMLLRADKHCSLLIKKASVDDSGDYEVRLRNVQNEHCACNAHLTVLEQEWKSVREEQELKITDGLKSFSAHAGTDVELCCRFQSTQNPEVYWYLNNMLIDSDDAKFSANHNRDTCYLQCRRISAQQCGTYTVKIVDSSGFDESQCCLSLLPNSVKFAPVFLKKLDEVNVMSGSDVLLCVKVNANPAARVIWFKNNNKISEQMIVRNANTYTLHLRKVCENDRAIYSVIASNECGETRTFARLCVHDDEDFRTRAPKFVKSFTDQVALRGENVLFEAKVSGSPKPKVRWLLNDKPIRNSRYYYSNVRDQYALTISNVCDLDSGRITLLVENKCGKATCSAHLHVSEDISEINRCSQHRQVTSQYKHVDLRSSSEEEEEELSMLASSSIMSDREEEEEARISRKETITTREKYYRERWRPHRPVEIRFSKPPCEKRFRSLERADKATRRQIIRLSSVPPVETSRKHAKTERSYAPIDIIVGKPVVRTFARDEFRLEDDDQTEMQQASTTVIRQREQREKEERMFYEIEGESSVLQIDEPITSGDNEILLSFPKGQHSSTVRKMQTGKHELHRIEQKQRLTGQDKVRHIRSPVKVQNEIDVRLAKGSHHTETIVKDTCRKSGEMYRLRSTQTIPGEHDVLTIDGKIEAKEMLDICLPKIEPSEHSSTVLKEKKEAEQVLSLNKELVVPGECSYEHVKEKIVCNEFEDVLLPKQGQHSSTVYKRTRVPVENYDLGVLKDEQRSQYEAERGVMDIRLPKCSHSSTLVCTDDEKYMSEEDDYRSTVVIEGGKQRVDVLMDTELSEFKQSLDKEYNVRKDHKTTLMTDLAEKQAKLQHSTTMLKNVRVGEVEMLIDRPNDAALLTAYIGEQSQPQTIHFPSLQLYEQSERQQVCKRATSKKRYSSVEVETRRHKSESIGVRMGTSSSELIARIKPRLQLTQQNIQTVGSSSLDIDLRNESAAAEVNVLMPAPDIEPSTSGIVVDLHGTLQGPTDSIKGAYSSELILNEQQVQTAPVELLVDAPMVESSSCRLVAQLASSLKMQSSVESRSGQATSTSTLCMDVGRGGKTGVSVNLGEIKKRESTSGVRAQLDSQLSVVEKCVQQTSSCSIQLPSMSAKAEVDVKADIRGRSELVASIPGEVKGVHRCAQMSTSQIEIVRSSAAAAEHTAHTSDLLIKDFGRKQVEMVLHPPVFTEQSSSMEDSRKFEASEGSVTVIKQFGSSPERYFIGDGGRNTSTFYMDINGVGDSGDRQFQFDAGSPIRLQVHMEGATEARWSKDGSHLIGDRYISTIDEKKIELFVQNACVSDSGVYECCAIDSFNRSRSYLFIVNVNDELGGTLKRKRTDRSLKFIEELPDRVCGSIGDQVRLQVKIEGECIKCTWSHNGIIIKESSVNSCDHSMVIPSVDHRYVGVYKVTIDGRYNSIESSCRVFVNDEKLDTFEVDRVEIDKPQTNMNINHSSAPTISILIPLIDTVCEEGDTIILACKIKPPTRNVRWYKDTRQLNDEGRCHMKVDEDGYLRLKIDRATEDDSAMYTVTIAGAHELSSQCRVNVKGAPRKFRANVSNQQFSAPVLMRQLDDTSVRVGETCRMKCRIYAHPIPKIKWLKNGRQLYPNTRINTQFEYNGTASLIIRNVEPSDAGQYIAMFENSVGSTSTAAKIEVLSLFSNEESDAMNATPPIFAVPPKSVTAADGQNVLLQCELVPSKERTKVCWLHNHAQLMTSERYKSYFDGHRAQLKIINISNIDKGIYTLIAENRFGSNSFSVSVDIVDYSGAKYPIYNIPKELLSEAPASGKVEPVKAEIDESSIFDPTVFKHLERTATNQNEHYEAGIDTTPLKSSMKIAQLEAARQAREKKDYESGIDRNPIRNLSNIQELELRNEKKNERINELTENVIDSNPLRDPNAFKYLEQRPTPDEKHEGPAVDISPIIDPNAFYFLEKAEKGVEPVVQAGVDDAPIVDPGAFRYIEPSCFSSKPKIRDCKPVIDTSSIIPAEAFAHLNRPPTPKLELLESSVDTDPIISLDALRYIEPSEIPIKKRSSNSPSIDTSPYVDPNAFRYLEGSDPYKSPDVEAGVDETAYIPVEAFKDIEIAPKMIYTDTAGPSIDTTSMISPEAFEQLERTKNIRKYDYSDEPSIDDTFYVNPNLFMGLERSKVQMEAEIDENEAGFQPCIQGNLDEQNVFEGQIATFEVIIIGVPYPTLSWTHNGSPISPSSRIESNYNIAKRVASLKINQCSCADSGIYQLTATNPKGSATSYGRLTVHDLPTVDETAYVPLDRFSSIEI